MHSLREFGHFGHAQKRAHSPPEQEEKLGPCSFYLLRPSDDPPFWMSSLFKLGISTMLNLEMNMPKSHDRIQVHRDLPMIAASTWAMPQHPSR